MNKLDLINVLVLGSGGREHAICWKLKQSPKLNQLYVAPGNSGTAEIAHNIKVDLQNYHEIKQVINDYNIKLLIIGPEGPLVAGLHDKLDSDKDISNLIIIGPKKGGAQLEGSKSFAKKFMRKYNIPTANYQEFDAKNWEDGVEYLKKSKPPFVIKVDGLAAGKGVFICNELNEAIKIMKDIAVKSIFGDAGNKIVIEDFLEGIELSVFILTNGNNYKILPTAKDYKRIGENDTGLNTGGMGAISPPSFLDKKLLKKIITKIIEPTLEGLKKEKIEYEGFIFFGLIKVNNEPFVIEYNVRLGDPETQAILPRIESDILEVCYDIKNLKKFENHNIVIKNLSTTTVILTSGGYPEKYEKGLELKGLENMKNCIPFHAGLIHENGKHITNGGRVLAITGIGENIRKARKNSYDNVKKINFKDLYFRKDIGLDIIK